MCLIAFAWNEHPRYALALIANRDEFHARAARPAAVLPDAPAVFGGVDQVGGGSWLQLSLHRRLAVVTNLREGRAGAPRPRSRGALVHDFVRDQASAADQAGASRSVAAQFAPYTLLLWDGQDCWQTGNHPAAHASPVAPGLHALSNAALDAPWPKSLRTQAALADWLGSPAAGARQPDPSALFAALADSSEAPDSQLPDTGVPLEWERRLSATFIRGNEYGTRCSTVVLATHAGELWFEERRFGPGGRSTGRSRAQAMNCREASESGRWIVADISD
jgi:uncharacterized protein with NRDE domain